MSENYNSREWMYKRFDEATGNFSPEFIAGVDNQFVPFANSQPLAQSNGGKFHCPCSVCKNEKFMLGSRVWKHLYKNGFMADYYVWYMHGEELDFSLGTSKNVDTTWASGSVPVGNVVEERYVDMVNDAFRENVNLDNYNQYDSYENVEEHDNYQDVEEPSRNHSKQFYDLLEGAQNPLYDGCREGHSQLSLAARVMQDKADHNMSERLVDSVCGMLREYLPEGNQAMGTHYETEKLLRNLGLPYHTIDVCINNCMIFWKEDEVLDKCRFCESPRWKTNKQRRRTNVPYSRMWYMPIADRLKRMYES